MIRKVRLAPKLPISDNVWADRFIQIVAEIRADWSNANPTNVPIDWTLQEVVDWHIRRVLAKCGGNKSKAARMLGINKTTMWRRLNGLRQGKKETGNENPQERCVESESM